MTNHPFEKVRHCEKIETTSRKEYKEKTLLHGTFILKKVKDKYKGGVIYISNWGVLKISKHVGRKSTELSPPTIIHCIPMKIIVCSPY
jgi:hypothetical protein